MNRSNTLDKKLLIFKDYFENKIKLKDKFYDDIQTNFSLIYLKDEKKIFDKSFNSQLVYNCKVIKNNFVKKRFKKKDIKYKFTNKKIIRNIKNLEKAKSFDFNMKKKKYIDILEFKKIYKYYFEDIYKIKNWNYDDIKIFDKLKSFTNNSKKNKKIERLKLNIIPSHLFKLKLLRNLFKQEKDLIKIDNICKNIFKEIKDINYEEKLKNKKENLNSKSINFIKKIELKKTSSNFIKKFSKLNKSDKKKDSNFIIPNIKKPDNKIKIDKKNNIFNKLKKNKIQKNIFITKIKKKIIRNSKSKFKINKIVNIKKNKIFCEYLNT